MAELGFILSREEEGLLIRHALAAGAWLVPDIDYSTSDVVRITSYQEYEEYRTQTRLFFILHQSYVREPIEMRETVKEGRRVFFVLQRNGGPTIEFLSSIEFFESGRAKINPGFLAHHKTFWNPRTQQNEDVPIVLLAFYRELSAVTKKISVRRKVGSRSYSIGNVVQRQIEGGSLDLGIVPLGREKT